jgi:DNA primase
VKKGDAEQFILQLLNDLDCKGVKSFPTGNIHCQCPFHRPRKNVSAFGISYNKEEKGFPYNCQSCGESGNLAMLVTFIHRCTYKKALKIIDKRVAVKPVTLKILSDEMVKLSELGKEIVQKNKVASLPPRSSNQKAMMRYLEKRKKKGRDVLNVRYIVNKYGLYYCGEGRMAGRIIMPIRINGQVVGINDRAVDDGVRNKSLHVAGQNYNELLYGLDEAVGKPVGVLVEGAFDMFQVVSALSKDNKINTKYGIVCNMGTSVSETKVALLLENFDEVVVMFDNQVNDKGVNDGFDGAVKWCRELRDYMPVRNITTEYPKGKDPGICTTEQITKALKSKGYVAKTSLQRLKDGSLIKL